jgi:hypothetical protein
MSVEHWSAMVWQKYPAMPPQRPPGDEEQAPPGPQSESSLHIVVMQTFPPIRRPPPSWLEQAQSSPVGQSLSVRH